MKKTVIVLSLALLAVLTIAAVGAIGQVTTQPVRPAPTTPRQSQAQQRVDQRAEMIKERIETIIARFNNNKDRHIAAYEAVKASITNIITTLSAKGYDTSKLASDLQAWNSMVVKAANDYAALIAALQTAEQYAPFASQGQFVAAINQARLLLRTYRQDVLDVRHEYQTVIRPDVQALKSQTPKQPATSAPSSTP
jgi:YesN/AraC family two-component response regulator